MGNTASGIYTINPQGTRTSAVTVRVYCDMSATGVKGQSIFDLPTGFQTFESGTNVCAVNWSNDDCDNTMMWVDFTGRVATTNSVTNKQMVFFVVPRDSFPATMAAVDAKYMWGGTTPTAAANEHYPSTYATSMNGYERPIPFPRSGHPNGVVVYLGQSNVFFRADGVDYSIPYPTSMSSCLPEASSASSNVNVFVTDGVSSVTIGRRASGDLTCLTVLKFDWSYPTYTSQMLSSTTVQTTGLSNPSNWLNTEEDFIGGDLLWTVKGKPSYYSNQYMYLGMSMTQPFSSSTSSYITNFPAGANVITQTGLDIFFKVDSAGAVWAADWGHDNGGLFNCGNDNQLGSMKTSIRLVT